jgi:DNA primase
MSVNAEMGLLHCFSCGKGADALEGYQIATGNGFSAAVAELEAAAGITSATARPSSGMSPPPAGKPRKVATSYYKDETGAVRYRTRSTTARPRKAIG